MNKTKFNAENLTWKEYLAGMSFWAIICGTVVAVVKTLKK
jgi:hypothetical protein